MKKLFLMFAFCGFAGLVSVNAQSAADVSKDKAATTKTSCSKDKADGKACCAKDKSAKAGASCCASKGTAATGGKGENLKVAESSTSPKKVEAKVSKETGVPAKSE